MAPRSPALAFLSCAALLALLPSVASDENQTLPFPIKPLDSFYKRISALQENSPTADTLRGNKSLADRLTPIYDLIDKLTNIVETRRAKNSSEACSLRHDAVWVGASRGRIERFQLGKMDETCLSLIEGELAIKEGQLDSSFRPKAMEDIRDARQALYEATSRSTLNKTLQQKWNWTNSYKLSGFSNVYQGQSCKAEYVFAYRKNKVWYLRHSLTDSPINIQQKDWKRNYTHEYIARDLSTLELPHRMLGDRSKIIKASVLMTSWAGSAAMGTVWANYADDEEQALATALRRNAIDIDLAEDSVTPSNIAILALPMVMSFVPVAFLADLDSLGMVVYGLLTDVFAAVPFFVKGIELVRSSTNRRIEVNAFYMGNSTLGQIEINGAECTGESRFGNIGWYFIVIAIGMMVTGVLLEVFAARFMARRRGDMTSNGNGAEELTGPFGAAMLKTTGQGYMGGEFERAENAYLEKMERLGLAQERRGWRRWLPGSGLRRRGEQPPGLGSADREFEAGYDTDSFDRDIAGDKDRPLSSYNV